MKISYLLLIALFLPHCESPYNREGGKEAPVISQVETKQEVLDIKVESAAELGLDMCFQVLLEDFYERDPSNPLMSKRVTRKGAFPCFIERHKILFDSMKVEFYHEMIVPLERDSLGIKIKEMVLDNARTAESLYKEYSKGYHDECMGLKEPHFLVLEDVRLYIVYTFSESERKALDEYKQQLLDRFSRCINTTIS